LWPNVRNANGSRKFKRLLDESDFDGLVSAWRAEEIKDGGQVLDVCVDFVGRNGREGHGRGRGALRAVK
jgi:5-methyltetrahydrofolate--homocysteine methyltransferase